MREKKGFLRELFGGKKSERCCDMEIVEEVEEIEDCGCREGCCGGSSKGELSIKILGSGCRNCVMLANNTAQALKEMGMEANVEKVTELSAIMGYGVMSTPALVINEKVVSVGKVLKPHEIVEILQRATPKQI